MSPIAKFVAYVLSHIVSVTPAFSEPEPSVNQAPSAHESNASPPNLGSNPQGSIYAIPNPAHRLQGAVTNPEDASVASPPAYDTSSTSFFDITLISDTSTSTSSSSVGVLSLSPIHASSQPQDHPDIFSPRRAPPYPYSPSLSPPTTPSPLRLLGLGISGIERKDGYKGLDGFGFGVVGVRRSYHHNPFIAEDEDEDEDEDGYASPTPRNHSHCYDDEEEEEDIGALSTTFMQELVFTWAEDPLHLRVLNTIVECADEDEDEEGEERRRAPASRPNPFLAKPPPRLPQVNLGRRDPSELVTRGRSVKRGESNRSSSSSSNDSVRLRRCS
ncbi:hypothetical protein FPV67DRAFT_1468981 [Lyophyllum atratum]|nr:hypothetical protein FPV67DRAFT_1468981 [Lyophyllum atratum]